MFYFVFPYHGLTLVNDIVRQSDRVPCMDYANSLY